MTLQEDFIKNSCIKEELKWLTFGTLSIGGWCSLYAYKMNSVIDASRKRFIRIESHNICFYIGIL